MPTKAICCSIGFHVVTDTSNQVCRLAMLACSSQQTHPPSLLAYPPCLPPLTGLSSSWLPFLPSVQPSWFLPFLTSVQTTRPFSFYNTLAFVYSLPLFGHIAGTSFKLGGGITLAPCVFSPTLRGFLCLVSSQLQRGAITKHKNT